MTMISKDKQYRTRDGCEVRIYATDGKDSNAVHGAVFRNGMWLITTWRADGCYAGVKSDSDLIEVKPRIRRTVWLNVYDDRVHQYDTRKEADNGTFKQRLACVKIEIDCEEGEGL
jgi:hypothetical protein